MRTGRIISAIGLFVAQIVASTATAQTADDARKFFDEVVANGTTQAIPLDSGRFYNPNMIFSPSMSNTASCESRMSGAQRTVTIDWSAVIEASSPGSGIYIIGGASSSSYQGSVPGLIIQTNSTAMDVRLLKAINMIVKNCAKPSHGF